MRAINDTYYGTLSSYAYVLLLLHYLQNVCEPPVLPNLQKMPPKHVLDAVEMLPYMCSLSPPVVHQLSAQSKTIRGIDGDVDECNTYFLDDPYVIGLCWKPTNRASIGKLMSGFFTYYAHEFKYRDSVVSVRQGGCVDKKIKGWEPIIQAKNNISFSNPDVGVEILDIDNNNNNNDNDESSKTDVVNGDTNEESARK